MSYLESFNYSTSQAREAATAATLGELKVSPDSSSGCSLLTRNQRSVTVSTRNQNNHFRTVRKLQQADARATGTQPASTRRGKQCMLGDGVRRRPCSIHGRKWLRAPPIYPLSPNPRSPQRANQRLSRSFPTRGVY